MDVTAIPQIQAFDPEKLVTNPAIRARRGDPKKDKIDRLATNMFERRESGQYHQIQPGIVRVLDNGTVEVIAGDHRRAAEVKLNSMIGEGSDKYMFLAIAVPEGDTQALLDAIDENEFRTAATVFDKGEAWAKLVDVGGMTQAAIATRYSVPESTVSEYIRAAKLPKKFQALVEKGELTEEAAIVLARYNKDPKLQEDLLALAQQEREAREAIHQRAEARAKGETEPEATAEGGKKGGKKSEGSAPVSEAVKGKKGGKKTAAGKTTASDVKGAVKKKGVGKKNVASGKSKGDFIKLLQSLFGENVEDVPEPYAELAEAIEEYFDGSLGDQAFKNRWVKCLRTKFASSASSN